MAFRCPRGSPAVSLALAVAWHAVRFSQSTQFVEPVVEPVEATSCMQVRRGSEHTGKWKGETTIPALSTGASPGLVTPGQELGSPVTARRNIAYVKVPKTGSSTTGGIFRRVAQRHGYDHATSADWRTNSTAGNTAALWANHASRELLGPFLKRRMPNSVFFGSVRRPAERCMSEFYHIEVADRHESETEEAKLAYILKDHCGDAYETDYLAERAGDSPEEVAAAYDLLMVTERLDESALAASLVLGVPLVDVLFTSSKNSTEMKWKHDPISTEPMAVQRALREISQGTKDAALYSLANRKLDQVLGRLGNRLAPELARFHQMLATVTQECHVGGRHENDCLWRDNGCWQSCIDELISTHGWH